MGLAFFTGCARNKSSVLSADSKRLLQENARVLKADQKISIQVEGHCDNRGGIQYNLALGERRATAVRKYLQHLGISSARISVISYGNEKPVDDRDLEEARRKNRRANFVVL